MTLSVWQRTIVNDSGDVLGSATVTVRRESDNALATLYDNPAGTGSPLSNPLTADSAGFAQFYVIAGVYRITAASGSFSAVWRHVQLGTAQSVDADQDLQTTDSVEFAALTVDDVTIDANTISTATGEDLTLSPAGDLIVSSNVTVTGDLTLSGDVAFTGSLEVDNLRLDGSTISSTTTGDNLELAPLSGVLTVDGDVVPKTDGTSDLGSPSLEWQNLYIDGTANIDSLVADTADIDGGTIDNTVIGGTIAAAGTFTSVDADYIDLATSTSPVPADAVGRLRWDQDEAGGTLMLGMSGGNVVQPVGEAQYYWVKASSAITKGQVIMASGVVGLSGKIEGAPATGLDKDTGIRVIGIAAENIANNEWGLVTSFGYVRGVNTNAFNANDILYLNPSVAGGLTNAMPAAPNPKVIVALVVVKDATNGELLVRVSHGQTFGSFATDAQITSPSGNDFLVYDGSNSRWENYTAANARTAMGLGTIATQDANNVNIDGGAIDGTTIGASTRAAGNFTTLDANGNVTLSGGTANGVLYLDGSKVATSGSALTFDGSNFGVVGSTGASGAVAAFTTVDNPAAGRDFLRFVRQGGGTVGSIEYSEANSLGVNSTTATLFKIGGAENMRLTSTEAVFNEPGNDYDFRVESDTNTHALFVDAGNGRIGVNTSSPEVPVDFNVASVQIRSDASGANEPKLIFNNDLFAGANHGFIQTSNGGLQLDFEGGSTSTFTGRAKMQLIGGGSRAVSFSTSTDNGSTFVERFKITNTDVIANDTGADQDFRVESDTNTHALFVDGATGSVGIGGVAAAGEKLNLTTASGTATNLVLNQSGIGAGNISVPASVNALTFGVYDVVSGIVERLRIDSSGALIAKPAAGTGAVFNEDGVDADFRVESDTNTHALFVQGSDGFVGIGTSSPSEKLEVSGNIKTSGNLIVASGQGIDFSATSDAGGMTSELLDDYEEGTWTPVIRGATTAGTYETALSVGTYTRVGRQVTIQCYMELANAITGGGSGYAQLTGLPFAKAADTTFPTGALFTKGVDWAAGNPIVTPITSGSTSTLYFPEIIDNAVNNNIDISGFSVQDVIAFTLTYNAV